MSQQKEGQAQAAASSKKGKRGLAIALTAAVVLGAAAGLHLAGGLSRPEQAGTPAERPGRTAPASAAPTPIPTPTPKRDWREDYPLFFPEGGTSGKTYIEAQMVALLEARQKALNGVRSQMTANLNGFFQEFGAAEFVPPEPVDVGREFLQQTVAELGGATDSAVGEVLGDVAAQVIGQGSPDWDGISAAALESIGGKISGSVQDAVLEASGLDGTVSAVQRADGALSALRDIFDGTPDYALARTLQDALDYAGRAAAVLEDPEADVEALYGALAAYNQFCAYRRAAVDLRDESGLSSMGEWGLYSSLAEVEAIDRALGVYAILLQSEGEGDEAWYRDLEERWERLPERIAGVREAAGVGQAMEYALPPNYDRRCLTYLERGNKVNTGILGAIGGALGSALGNQTRNMTQEDIERLHTAVNDLTNGLNDAFQQAERSRNAWQAVGFLTDRVFDPGLTGPALERQILFLEQMYPEAGEREGVEAMLHDAARAVVTARCAEEIYAAFLSESAERTDYLGLLSGNRGQLQYVLDGWNVRAEDCLSQEELDGIYRWAVECEYRLGSFVHSSQIWRDTRTMQTPILAMGRDAGMAVGDLKVLTTWRDTTAKTMMYATDPKGDVTAFYGFGRTGEPLCFVRGEDRILFDWETGGGQTLYTNCDEEKTQAVYRFAAFLREERNGFGKNEYRQYQTAY